MEEREALKRLKHREEDALAWFIGRYADCYWLYPAPVDITQMDHIRFGDLAIPVNPEEPPLR